MDLALGVVMDAVRSDARLANNTLVLMTSDNGSPQAPDGNAPLRGYKHQVWGGYREPGIVWWPGRVKAGAFNRDALVATYDIFPTLLARPGLLSVERRPHTRASSFTARRRASMRRGSTASAVRR